MTLLGFLIFGGFAILLCATCLGGLCWSARHSDPDVAAAMAEPLSPAPEDHPLSSRGPACADSRGAISPGAGEYLFTWVCLSTLSLSLSTLFVLGVVKAAELFRNH